MIKKQKGYLLIVALVAIVIVGLVSKVLVDIYTSSTRSTTNILQANQALYIAQSALELAKRDLLTNSSKKCEDINFSNQCYPPSQSTDCTGRYDLLGTPKSSSTILSGNITADATIIPVSNPSSLDASGIIVIDNETIWYSGVTGTLLQNAKRGILGTNKATHNSSASVKQNLCTLTSTAYVPNKSQPEGIRVIKNILWKKSGKSTIGNFPEGVIPTLVARSSVTLSGDSSVWNPVILGYTDEQFSKCTIVSGSSVAISGSAANTRIAPSYILASNRTRPYRADISEYDSLVNTTSEIWNIFFDKTRSEIKNEYYVIASNCTQTTVRNAVNNGHNRIWLASSCGSNYTQSSYQLGSTTNPIIIVSEPNVRLSNNAQINGFVYTYGTLRLSGNISGIIGLAATEKTATLLGVNRSIVFNQTILETLGLLKPGNKYSDYYMTLEDFN